MWKKILRSAVFSAAEEVIRTYVLPLLAPFGVGILGWLQDIPSFYLAVGIILAFAAGITWFVRLDEWRKANNPEHKLTFRNMKLHFTQNDGRLAAVRFGFDLRNAAAFPVEFRVDELKTSITTNDGGHALYPPNKDYEKRNIITDPNNVGWFYDHAIALPEGLQGGAIGQLQCRLAYGRRGRLHKTIHINKKTIIFFGEKGFSGGVEWHDQ